ncbi:MAG: DUF4234 domain-containing protein [Firmicutes bacterium]|nr:DUF4234 domain-containing protein [Bacillota bacterium]
MKKRGIGVMILLYIFTFGIYAIVWPCMFQGELKKETGEGFGPWGHFFMSIFTFGIYAIYWQYAAGKRLAKLGATDRGILYLIFCFIALSWLNPFLMQSQANGLTK